MKEFGRTRCRDKETEQTECPLQPVESILPPLTKRKTPINFCARIWAGLISFSKEKESQRWIPTALRANHDNNFLAKKTEIETRYLEGGKMSCMESTSEE